MAFIHPQTNREFPHEFGGKSIKMWRMMTFGKQISKLIMSRDELNQQITPENLFTNKMIINLNVLGLSMNTRLDVIAKALTLSHQRRGGRGTKIPKSRRSILIQYNSAIVDAKVRYSAFVDEWETMPLSCPKPDT